jgi:hypothetical protein
MLEVTTLVNKKGKEARQSTHGKFLWAKSGSGSHTAAYISLTGTQLQGQNSM